MIAFVLGGGGGPLGAHEVGMLGALADRGIVPELVVSVMRKDLRPGKVFVDWSQNDEHKTTVAVYSLRAKERPTVSTPLRWEEVEAVTESEDPDELAFTSADVLVRVAEHGDRFAAVEELEQELPAL